MIFVYLWFFCLLIWCCNDVWTWLCSEIITYVVFMLLCLCYGYNKPKWMVIRPVTNWARRQNSSCYYFCIYQCNCVLCTTFILMALYPIIFLYRQLLLNSYQFYIVYLLCIQYTKVDYDGIIPYCQIGQHQS